MNHLTTNQVAQIKKIAKRAGVVVKATDNLDYVAWRVVESLLDRLDSIDRSVKALKKGAYATESVSIPTPKAR